MRQMYHQTDYIVSDGIRSYYSSGFAKDIVHIGANTSPSTLAHELFHKLDSRHEISRTFTESLAKDYVILNMVSGGNIKDYLLQKYPEAFSRVSKAGVPVMGEAYRGIADILNGLSGGKESYGFKHSVEYWSRLGALESEAWAQFGRMQYDNNVNVLKLCRKIFPNFYADAIIALKGLMRDVGRNFYPRT